jgi:hypothetical protein
MRGDNKLYQVRSVRIKIHWHAFITGVPIVCTVSQMINEFSAYYLCIYVKFQQASKEHSVV